jgi:hypothetical protein
MPCCISACATGTMLEREASRAIPWCEARSERPPLFRRASSPVPSLPLTLRERAAPPDPPPHRRSNEPTTQTRPPRPTESPETAFGHVPARVMPNAERAPNLRISASLVASPFRSRKVVDHAHCPPIISARLARVRPCYPLALDAGHCPAPQPLLPSRHRKTRGLSFVDREREPARLSPSRPESGTPSCLPA